MIFNKAILLEQNNAGSEACQNINQTFELMFQSNNLLNQSQQVVIVGKYQHVLFLKFLISFYVFFYKKFVILFKFF